MKYKFTCDCPEKKFSAAIISGWEVWRVNDDGDLEEKVESGDDGWDHLVCNECDEPVTEEEDVEDGLQQSIPTGAEEEAS